MEPQIEHQRLEAWKSFLQAHATLIDRLESELQRDASLPLTWYDVLVQLNRVPEQRLRLQDLGRALVISKSGLTRRIDRMEEAGLVERRHCSEDARGVYAVLTAKGNNVLEASAPIHLRGVQKHFARHLSDEEAAALQSAFTKVLEYLQASSLEPASAC